jgi:hypothetical protein
VANDAVEAAILRNVRCVVREKGASIVPCFNGNGVGPTARALIMRARGSNRAHVYITDPGTITLRVLLRLNESCLDVVESTSAVGMFRNRQ